MKEFAELAKALEVVTKPFKRLQCALRGYHIVKTLDNKCASCGDTFEYKKEEAE